jgi:outer membrane protein assembly factor BamB
VSGLTHYGVVDAGDGRELWSYDVGQQVQWLPISDGSLVIGPAVDERGAPTLVGLGLQDGTRFWEVPLPSHVQRVVGVGGHLVVLTANETVVLH